MKEFVGIVRLENGLVASKVFDDYDTMLHWLAANGKHGMSAYDATLDEDIDSRVLDRDVRYYKGIQKVWLC